MTQGESMSADHLATHELLPGAADESFVTMRRSELFELLGEYALPPWQLADGTEVGGDIDCASLAAELIVRVDTISLHHARVGTVASLGVATTRDLLAELAARADVGGYADYRTVDS